jgi:multicomponent K+:H+ antiporter subunit E
LSSTISLTPGTLSADFSKNKSILYVHVLHLDDGQAIIDNIKNRYEQPLKEIFKC